MSEVPDGTLDLFLNLLGQVGQFYRSSFGKELTPADWLAFQRAVEAFDHAAGGIILGKERPRPALCQPAKALQAMIDRNASHDHNRAYHQLSRYEFVFQVLRKKALPGIGPKLGRVLDGALDKLGLARGMDLSPYERDLNALTQPNYHLLRTGRHLTDDDADFYFPLGRTKDGYSDLSIKFDDPDAVVARFERQFWWTPVLDMEIASDLRCEVHEDVTRQLREVYRTEPKRLMQRPVRWILWSQLVLDLKPKGRGWKQLKDQQAWERNEVMWLAPGAIAPKSETL